MTNFFIVTPSYNQDKYLVQTITSILRQRGKFNLNYWVMDGGSTDASKKILKIFGQHLSFEAKKDKGQSDAINKGIKKISNNQFSIINENIFAYLNSDDYYLPGALQAVARAFKSHPEKKWLVGDCQIISSVNQQIQFAVKLYKYFWRLLPLKLVLPILNPIPQPAVFIRIEAVKQLGLFNEKLNFVMDYDYWLRLLKAYGEPIKLNQSLATFRIHPKSKGGTQFIKQFEEELLVAKKYFSSTLRLQLHFWHNKMITFIYKFLK